MRCCQFNLASFRLSPCQLPGHDDPSLLQRRICGQAIHLRSTTHAHRSLMWSSRKKTQPLDRSTSRASKRHNDRGCAIRAELTARNFGMRDEFPRGMSVPQGVGIRHHRDQRIVFTSRIRNSEIPHAGRQSEGPGNYLKHKRNRGRKLPSHRGGPRISRVASRKSLLCTQIRRDAGKRLCECTGKNLSAAATRKPGIPDEP
jgi:hypothetical protein